MATDDAETDWQRACTRGAVIGLVASVHVALFIAILVPAKPRPPATRTGRFDANVLHVELLAPTPRAAQASPTLVSPAPSRQPDSAPRPRQPARATSSIAVTLAPSPAAPVAIPPPTFIAGGGFAARLRAAQVPTQAPQLPGGHHYLAADLQFQTIAQRSIAGKVHKVAGLLFGRFDPVCKNTQYELAKTRKQMLADGFTMEELEQREREHHCH